MFSSISNINKGQSYFSIIIDPMGGARIDEISAVAFKIAQAVNHDVNFSFNDTLVVAYPADESADVVEARFWKARYPSLLSSMA